jgi:hypothetical protein
MTLKVVVMSAVLLREKPAASLILNLTLTAKE